MKNEKKKKAYTKTKVAHTHAKLRTHVVCTVFKALVLSHPSAP